MGALRSWTARLSLVFAAVLVGALGFNVGRASAVTANCFTDVQVGAWYHDFVCWLYDNGLSSGYPDGTFRPDNNITRAEVAVFMQRGYELAQATHWGLGGNAGTTAGTDFLGTTDDQAFELHVNSARALRLEPGTVPNLIGGAPENDVIDGAFGVSILGGGEASSPHTASDNYGFVGGGLGNTIGNQDGDPANARFSVVAGGLGNQATGGRSFVGAGASNSASGFSATVGGGESNSATADWSTIGGGANNLTSGFQLATVSGGWNNESTGWGTSIGGGRFNTASSDWATVAGGQANTASNWDAVVAGGSGNTASGLRSSVAGGIQNTASGDYSFAVGQNNLSSGNYSVTVGQDNVASAPYAFALGAKSVAKNEGAFLWADHAAGDFTFDSAADNEFAVRSTGGARFVSAIDVTTGAPTAGVELLAGAGAWSTLSDQAAKENFAPVDSRATLEALIAIPIQSWSWKAEAGDVSHIGPTAQDFQAAFGVGSDATRITTVDADGVALASIQGLYEIVQEQQVQLEALRSGEKSGASEIAWLWVLGGLAMGIGLGRRWERREPSLI